MGGVPGTSSNLPNAQVPAASKSTQQTESSKSESGTYGVNRLVRHTVQPAGRIKRIAAALLVDDAVQVAQQNNTRAVTRRKRTADEMKQIEDLAAAALGIDAKRGDLLAVENLSFQNLQEDAPAPLRCWRSCSAIFSHGRGCFATWLLVVYLAAFTCCCCAQ